MEDEITTVVFHINYRWSKCQPLVCHWYNW